MKKIIIVSLLSFLLVGCNQQTFYTGLAEKDANDMIAILLSNDISCTKQSGGENLWTITINKYQFSQGVQLLKSAGYPKDTFESMGNTFKKSGLVSSPTEEKIRFIHALSNELAETLTHINGVVTARVHIVLPDNDPSSEQTKPSSASVFISHLQQINLEDCMREIRQLVTNSIEGLSYDKVNVSLFPAANTSNNYSVNSKISKKLFGIKINVASIPAFIILLFTVFIFGITIGVLSMFLLQHRLRQSKDKEIKTPTK